MYYGPISYLRYFGAIGQRTGRIALRARDHAKGQTSLHHLAIGEAVPLDNLVEGVWVAFTYHPSQRECCDMRIAPAAKLSVSQAQSVADVQAAIENLIAAAQAANVAIPSPFKGAKRKSFATTVFDNINAMRREFDMRSSHASVPDYVTIHHLIPEAYRDFVQAVTNTIPE